MKYLMFYLFFVFLFKFYIYVMDYRSFFWIYLNIISDCDENMEFYKKGKGIWIKWIFIELKEKRGFDV